MVGVCGGHGRSPSPRLGTGRRGSGRDCFSRLQGLGAAVQQAVGKVVGRRMRSGRVTRRGGAGLWGCVGFLHPWPCCLGPWSRATTKEEEGAERGAGRARASAGGRVGRGGGWQLRADAEGARAQAGGAKRAGSTSWADRGRRRRVPGRGGGVPVGRDGRRGGQGVGRQSGGGAMATIKGAGRASRASAPINWHRPALSRRGPAAPGCQATWSETMHGKAVARGRRGGQGRHRAGGGAHGELPGEREGGPRRGGCEVLEERCLFSPAAIGRASLPPVRARGSAPWRPGCYSRIPAAPLFEPSRHRPASHRRIPHAHPTDVLACGSWLGMLRVSTPLP